MVLEKGRRYTGSPGQQDFVVTRFQRHAVRLESQDGVSDRKLEARPSLELLRRGDLEALAELQWRVSIPLSTVLLTLMAVVMALRAANSSARRCSSSYSRAFSMAIAAWLAKETASSASFSL